MAKNREIVTRNSNKNSIQLDEITDAQLLKPAILRAPIPQLLQSQELFNKINTLLWDHERTEIYDYLLSKSSIITTNDSFKINVILNAIQTIYQVHKNSHCAIKNEQYTRIITIANQGLKIYCNILTSNALPATIDKNLPNSWNEFAKIAINDLAQSDFKKGFDLAQLSFQQRVKILFNKINAKCPSPLCINILPSLVSTYLIRFLEDTKLLSEKSTEEITAVLQANNQIVELSLQSDDPKIILSGLAHAEELYNMATIFNQPEFRQDALKHLAILHGTLGDNNKAQTLKTAAENVLSDNSKIIKKFGQTNAETLQIKEQIKAETLDPIYQAASIGKWTNVQLGRWYIPTEQGVTGYLPLTSDADYDTKMGLIFESIILAVNNSENHDPTCAIIFAQQYPNIMKYVIEHHPEYFINSDILHLCAEKLDIKELQELTNNTDQIPSSYKSYQEKAITPFIEKRLTTDNITQQVKGLTTGPWDQNTQGQLLKLFEALTIGNNLGAISDSIKIARMLMIKEVVNSIAESNSLNFAPFNVICQQYPELIQEIYKDHPEYFDQHKVIFSLAGELVEQENKVPQVIHQEGQVQQLHKIEQDIENEYTKINLDTINSDPVANLMGQHNILTIEGA